MAKKYSQAKKHNNPFAAKHPNSRKHRLTVISVVGVFVVLGVFWMVGYVFDFSNKGKDESVVKAEKPIKNAKDVHPKKVVKPLSDEDFKGAKEYNFYTQLEERALILGEEERFGGISLDNIHEPPKISLESMSQSTSTPKANTNDLAIAPLILESSQQKKVESVKNVSKPEVKPKGIIGLQVGSFSSKKDAEKHQNFLATYGFSAQILQGKNQSQQDVYRVRIGGLTSQEADSVKKRLNTLGVSYFEVK